MAEKIGRERKKEIMKDIIRKLHEEASLEKDDEIRALLKQGLSEILGILRIDSSA